MPRLARHSRQDSAPDLSTHGPDLYTLHRADGTAVRVQGNAVRVTGREVAALTGTGFLTNVMVQDRPAVAHTVAEALRQGRGMVCDFRLTSPDGTVRWFELRCEPAPHLTLPGEGLLALGVTRDITRRKQLEEEQACERRRAEHANLAKSRFLAHMSHELRTPLNAILGFSELLQSPAMENLPAERGREYVGLIHDSAEHLLALLNDILDMSKIEAGKYDIIAEPFSLGPLLANCAGIMRGQADIRAIAIDCGDLSELPEVTADQRALRQVFINLLSNAVKFTGEGGRIEIEAVRSGRTVRISVRDNGIGISPEHMELLGQPFYQADSRYDRQYEGTGLGLSVVKGLVELHHGRLHFASRKGEGTTVTVVLPITPPEGSAVPAEERVEVLRPLAPAADAEVRRRA